MKMKKKKSLDVWFIYYFAFVCNNNNNDNNHDFMIILSIILSAVQAVSLEDYRSYDCWINCRTELHPQCLDLVVA